MQRLLSMTVILALVTFMTVPSTMHDSTSGSEANTTGHAQLAEFSWLDMLANCCGFEESKMHHAIGGCAMDCNNAVPSIIAFYAETEADLRIVNARGVQDDIALLPFRPPIAI